MNTVKSNKDNEKLIRLLPRFSLRLLRWRKPYWER